MHSFERDPVEARTLESREIAISPNNDYPEVQWLYENGFRVLMGVNGHFAQELVDKSKEEEMRRFVPRDHAERFTSIEAFKRWYKPTTEMYCLADKSSGDLAGVTWFSIKENPVLKAHGFNPDATFAIRIYGTYRGMHLMQPFMLAAHKDYARLRQRQSDGSDTFKGVWLDVDKNNVRAQKGYEKFGYKQVAADKDRLIMVLSPESTQDLFGSKG